MLDYRSACLFRHLMHVRGIPAAALAAVALLGACSRAPHQAPPGPISMPSATPKWPNVVPRNGLEVVGWIRRTHPGRELRALRYTVTTEYVSSPPRATQAVAYASLPGKLRLEQMPTTSRTGDIRDRQRLAVFRAGRRISTARRVDLRTLLIFDLFAQNADTTIMWLDSAKVRFGIARAGELAGRDMWVVGATAGDDASTQFWVDAEHWRVARIIQRDPRDPDAVIDVRYTDYTELLDVPVPTRIEVWRDGRLSEVQTFSDFTVNPTLPPRAFDLSRWRAMTGA